MIFSAFVFFSLLQISTSEPTITYTCPGKNAKAVFEELSNQAGQTLLIGGSLADEPIILRLDKAPLSKTMDRLAYALNGEWKEEKEGKRLVEKKPKPEETPYDFRLRKIIAMQKAAKDELASAKPFDERAATKLKTELEAYFRKLESEQQDEASAYESGNEFEHRGPDNDFGKQIFLLLDPKKLAEIERNERIVWSTHPTARQRPLPPTIWKLAASYVQQSLLWRNHLQKNSELLGKLNEFPYAFSHLIPYDLVESRKSSRSLTQGVKLNIETVSFSGSAFYLNMTFLDQNFKIVHELSSRFTEPTNTNPRPSQVPILKPIEEPIVLNSLALELAKLIESWSQSDPLADGSSKPPKLTKELENALLHPEITDPMAISAGPILIQYAEAKGVQLAAVLSDTLVFAAQANPEGVVDQSRFLRFFRPGREYRAEEQGGWLTVGLNSIMASNGTSFSKRIPRFISGPFLRQVIKDKFESIEAVSTFLNSLQQDLSNYSIYSIFYPLEILGIDLELLNSPSSRTTLQLYSALSPMQHVAIRNGEEIVFASLSERQKETIRYELFAKVSPSLSDGKIGSTDILDEFQSDEMYKIETTEQYAPDIHPNARLRLTFEPNPIVEAVGTDSDGETISRYFSPKDLVKRLEAEKQEGTEFKKYRHHDRRTLVISIQLDKKYKLNFDATENRGKTLLVDSIDKLPPDILRQIRKNTEVSLLQRIPPWKQAS